MYGISSLLAINPGTSLDVVVYLPMSFARAFVSLRVSSDVLSPLMISTSFMTGTGFMKCIPITFYGLLVQLAILVIEIEEVFEARIALSLVNTLSRSLNTFSFAYSFSMMALITKNILRSQNHTFLTN